MDGICRHRMRRTNHRISDNSVEEAVWVVVSGRPGHWDELRPGGGACVYRAADWMKRTIRVSVSQCSFAFDSDCCSWCSDTLASDFSVMRMWLLLEMLHCRPAYPCPSIAWR